MIFFYIWSIYIKKNFPIILLVMLHTWDLITCRATMYYAHFCSELSRFLECRLAIFQYSFLLGFLLLSVHILYNKWNATFLLGLDINGGMRIQFDQNHSKNTLWKRCLKVSKPKIFESFTSQENKQCFGTGFYSVHNWHLLIFHSYL